MGVPMGSGATPCKIAIDPSGQFDFSIKATDMPVKIKLCEDHLGAPAQTTSFNQVDVFKFPSNPPQKVAGQPTAVSATNFTLNLAAGTYDIVMVLNKTPAAQVAFVFEDCGGLNQLARIPVVIQPSGSFSLRVT